MESNGFYASYMNAFELASKDVIRRPEIFLKPCYFDGIKKSERIAYLLPYSSSEGINKVLPAKSYNVIVKKESYATTMS